MLLLLGAHSRALARSIRDTITVMLAVDIHCHVLVPESADLVAPYADEVSDEFQLWSNERTRAYNAEAFRGIAALMTDPRLRLEAMNRMGVDVDVISITPTQYYYWAEPELGHQAAALQNEAIARFVEFDPARFVGLGTLPMQDPAAAVGELRRIVTEYGFPGVTINPSARGTDYDGPAYEEFWKTVHELDLLVVLHPNGTVDGRRLADYYLINVVGNPMEMTIALIKIVLGGIVERYPGIKILGVHGGGYLTFYLDRMDHAAAVRPDVGYKINGRPSDHLKTLYFDTVVHGAGLAHLVELVGPGHVLMGTDFPYDMGDPDPIGRIKSLTSISNDERADIMGGNAAKLLGLDI